MKKIVSLLLIFALLFTMCACAGNGDTSNNGEDGSNNGSSSLNSDNQSGTSNNGDGGSNNGSSSPNSGNQGGTIEQTDSNYPVTMNTFYRNTIGADILSDDPAVKEVDKKADALLKAIEDAPDTLKPTGNGKTYYISNSGNDKNDGLSPKTARQTYAAVYPFLKEGDVVLFNRGDVFRGFYKLVSGVSFGAYGKGIKPRIYGSVDGKLGKWTDDGTGVWTYNQTITEYSNIVFNNGEKVGRIVTKKANLTKKEFNVFYSGSRISVYSPNGNPANLFDSIEIVQGTRSIFTGDASGSTRNVTVQNLCIMYGGVHGFGSLGYSYDMLIEGCVIGFMGGRDLYRGEKSLGNAIEFMGGATNVTVRNNYIFQCYDTGITHQGPMNNSRSAEFDNITYDNNLIEYCVWAIESWIYARDGATAADKATGNTFNYGTVNITNNICRYSGWGWGSLDRPDKNVYADLIYSSLNHIEPLNIIGNIFDRSRRSAFNLQKGSKANLMVIKDNTVLAAQTTRIFDGQQDIALAEAAMKNFSNSVSGNTIKKVK